MIDGRSGRSHARDLVGEEGVGTAAPLLGAENPTRNMYTYEGRDQRVDLGIPDGELIPGSADGLRYVETASEKGFDPADMRLHRQAAPEIGLDNGSGLLALLAVW